MNLISEIEKCCQEWSTLNMTGMKEMGNLCFINVVGFPWGQFGYKKEKCHCIVSFPWEKIYYTVIYS